MTLTSVGKNEEGEEEFIGTRQEWDEEDVTDYLIKQAEENPEIFEEPKKVEIKLSCPECEREYRKGEDARVDSGMKCGRCAYGYGD